jgi:hypothetical protein
LHLRNLLLAKILERFPNECSRLGLRQGWLFLEEKATQVLALRLQQPEYRYARPASTPVAQAGLESIPFQGCIG